MGIILSYEKNSKPHSFDYILGKGKNSIILRGEINNKYVAVKRINIKKILLKEKEREKEENASLNSIFNELNSFKRVGNHSFIVTLHSAFRHNVCCYFVLDCLSGGDLRHFLKINGSLNEESVVYIVGCIGSALHHIHNRGVIHRDVKPENIGLDSLGRPYLTDFGISLVSSCENPIPISDSSSGTLPYLSPEVLSPGNFHSHQSDYWSLGVLAYELYYNRRPHRLCPSNMVQFVSNQYGWMWKELKKELELDLKQKIHVQALLELSPWIDFSNINQPSDWKLPFPDLDLHLNQNGSVPSCLMIPFPFQPPINSLDFTSIPSEEFKSLLNGLLDVRIPYRLGNLTRYSEFSDHQCFLKYKYDSNSHQSSPLYSLLQSPRFIQHKKYLKSLLVPTENIISYLNDSLDSQGAEYLFTEKINQKLSTFFYIPSRGPLQSNEETLPEVYL